MTEKTIYLIDDDEAVLTSMERLLRLEGFSVKPFCSAEAFLKTYEGTFTGCVISDVRMPPGMSGLDLLLTLRKLKSQLPVIFLTGYSDVPAAVRAIKTGAVNFLLKPARIPDLLSAIRESFCSMHPKHLRPLKRTTGNGIHWNSVGVRVKLSTLLSRVSPTR